MVGRGELNPRPLVLYSRIYMHGGFGLYSRNVAKSGASLG